MIFCDIIALYETGGRSMKIQSLFMMAAVMSFCVLSADGAIVMKGNNNDAAAEVTDGGSADWRQSEEYAEAQDIAQLEEDIRILDEEIAKCQKKKKGWTAATIVGGVGVAATGIAAIVQANKVKDKKNELSDRQSELKDKKSELNSLK